MPIDSTCESLAISGIDFLHYSYFAVTFTPIFSSMGSTNTVFLLLCTHTQAGARVEPPAEDGAADPDGRTDPLR